MDLACSVARCVRVHYRPYGCFRMSFDRAEYYVNPSFEYSIYFALNGELALTHCRDSRKTSIFGFGRIYNPTDYNNRIEINNSQ